MTTAKKADRQAEEKGSGQGTTSNEGGTAAGPGSSSATGSRQDNQRNIQGTDRPAPGRPGHKANS